MSTPLTEDEIAALEELEKAATPGEWTTGQGDHWSREVRAGFAAPAWCGAKNGQNDAALIVALRNAAPRLLAMARRSFGPEEERKAEYLSEKSDKLRYLAALKHEAVVKYAEIGGPQSTLTDASGDKPCVWIGDVPFSIARGPNGELRAEEVQK